MIENIITYENTILHENVNQMEMNLFNVVDELDSPTKFKSSSKLNTNTYTNSTYNDRCIVCGGNDYKNCSHCDYGTESSSSGTGYTKKQHNTHSFEDELNYNGNNCNINNKISVGRVRRDDKLGGGIGNITGSSMTSVSTSNTINPVVKNTGSKLRNRLQSARDEKHFMDCNDII